MSSATIEQKKEKATLKSRLALVGAGIGLGLFAFFGILYGSLLGGVIGLNVAGFIFGSPVAPSVIARAVIALSMLIGVMVSGLMFIASGASLGWLIGLVVEKITSPAVKTEKEKLHLK